MNFDADKNIKKEQRPNFNDDRLHLAKFEMHRRLLGYCLDFHAVSIFVLFIQKKFENYENISKNKLNYISYIILFYVGLSYLEDFKYTLYRKDKEDGFLDQFKQYEKRMFNQIKNYFMQNSHNGDVASYKINKHNVNSYSPGESMDIHILLQDLDKINEEYNKKIQNLSRTSPDYLKNIKEIDNLKKLKKQIETKILELNKNKFI